MKTPDFIRQIKRKIRKARRRLLFLPIELLINAGLDKMAARLGLFKPKLIRYLDGGLASQMIMFAKAYHYALERNLPMYLDLHWYSVDGMDVLGVKNRQFLLFDLFPEIKKEYEDKIIHSHNLFQFLFSDDNKYSPDWLAPRSLYQKRYGGEIRCLLQHLDEMKRLFRFEIQLSEEEKHLAERIDNTNSCALDIRKGDFVGTVHDVCSDSYYINAITQMQKCVPDCIFYIFSNDEDYARNMVSSLDGNFVFIANRSEVQPGVDMWLMQRCKHAIISNSGFSLTPAILSYSSEKKVILPGKWNQTPAGNKIAKGHQLPGWDIIDC